MTSERNWVWCGYPGHFIASNNCRMHMHTRVGDFRVSTVGDYHPPSIEAGQVGVPEKNMQQIGAGPDAFFETMVFEVEGHGSHGEGDVVDWGGVTMERYATAEQAEQGHMMLCREYTKKRRPAPSPERTET
jgi:hypothetical protein